MECEHARCTLPVEPEYRFCPRHREELRLELAALPTPLCSSCGNLMPEGTLKHNCERPAPQPPAEEL